jgi:hypothetical protein
MPQFPVTASQEAIQRRSGPSSVLVLQKTRAHLITCSGPGQRRLEKLGLLLFDYGPQRLAQGAEGLVVQPIKSAGAREWFSPQAEELKGRHSVLNPPDRPAKASRHRGVYLVESRSKNATRSKTGEVARSFLCSCCCTPASSLPLASPLTEFVSEAHSTARTSAAAPPTRCVQYHDKKTTHSFRT